MVAITSQCSFWEEEEGGGKGCLGQDKGIPKDGNAENGKWGSYVESKPLSLGKGVTCTMVSVQHQVTGTGRELTH